MIAVVAAAALVVSVGSFALGFLLSAMLTSGVREDSYRAGYSAARAQSIEGQAAALRCELDNMVGGNSASGLEGAHE